MRTSFGPDSNTISDSSGRVIFLSDAEVLALYHDLHAWRIARSDIPSIEEVREHLIANECRADGVMDQGYASSIREIRQRWGLGLVEAKGLYTSLHEV